MIKDLINELKDINYRLEPIDINFHNISDILSVRLVYKDIKCIIGKDIFTIYSYDDDKIINHLICSNNYTLVLDLIMLLYNNKEKITEIVLKYL